MATTSSFRNDGYSKSTVDGDGNMAADQQQRCQQAKCNYSIAATQSSRPILDTNRLPATIPEHLRISILYQDDDIVVINKPANLRSVPGHKYEQQEQPSSRLQNLGMSHRYCGRKRSRSDSASFTTAPESASFTTARTSGRQNDIDIAPDISNDSFSSTHHQSLVPQRMTAHEAWTKAARSFALEPSMLSGDSVVEARTATVPVENENSSHLAVYYVSQLAQVDALVTCLPRKFVTFQNYLRRNYNKIFTTPPPLHDRLDPPNIGNSSSSSSSNDSWNTITRDMYQCIERRQRFLLQLPEPTDWVDSAEGQLELSLSTMVGPPVADQQQQQQQQRHTPLPARNHHLLSQLDRSIFVVHRLDCATSGVMVFARHPHAASQLAEAWRTGKQQATTVTHDDDNDDDDRKGHEASELDQTTITRIANDSNSVIRNCDGNDDGCVVPTVRKVYWARVTSWPPWQIDGQTTGVIDLPLEPSDERLKWRVATRHQDNLSPNAKQSKTLWRVMKLHDRSQHDPVSSDFETTVEITDPNAGVEDTVNDIITLELIPITGRTHQLRVHCAAVTSGGIVGDSLYGNGTWAPPPRQQQQQQLQLTTTTAKIVQSQRLYLHATKLEFPHPRTGKYMKFCIPPDW